VNTRVATSVALVAAVLGLSLTPLVVLMQGEPEWLVTAVPEDPYILQPVTFKAYLYSPFHLVVYHVECRLTLKNDTDIIWFDTVSGAPAVLEFSLERVGAYELLAYCIGYTEEGEVESSFSFSLTARYPEPEVEYSAPWGRPLQVVVKTPYKYTGVPVSVTFGGDAYEGALVDGVALFTLPPALEPSVIRVTLLGEEREFLIQPVPPKELKVEFSDGSFVNASSVIAYFADNEGPIPVVRPVELATYGPCEVKGGDFHTNTWYTVVSTRDNPFERGECGVTAVSEAWSGMVMFGLAEAVLKPVNMTDFRVSYTNTTPWQYTITASLKLDHPVKGNFSLYVNERAVANVTGVMSEFTASYSAELLPGLYAVRAEFDVGVVSISTVPPLLIEVPRYRYVINPLPEVVYAGEELPSVNAFWYVYERGEYTYIVAFYPGDRLYEANSTMFRVRVKYPEVRLNETWVEVRNAAPGSTIKLYCVVGGESILVAEYYIRGEVSLHSVPPVYDCDKVVAVYTYKSYVKIVEANDPEPVVVYTTVCLAGEPCTILRSSAKIARAEIAGREYTPGTPIRLPAGYYAMKIYFTDGLAREVHILVKPVPVRVIAYKVADVWVVEVKAPPYAEVKVVLGDGRTLTLKPGTHTLYREPVSAYWEYGTVEMLKVQSSG